MDWKDRVVSDPNVLHGKARIRGTRIQVSIVLDNLAAGHDAATIIDAYPSLSEEDIRAALSYAAELARAEDIIPLRA